MTTHLIAAPAPAAVTAVGAWKTLSAALTGQVAALAERTDLTVICVPGAGHGAPGCFLPALAVIELDGTHLLEAGCDPATCDPSRPADRDRYPALWGVLVHEAAHARHTAWTPPTPTPTSASVSASGRVSAALAGPAAWVEAAIVLEESRIEAAHLRRRPADHRWLRAAATHLVLADFTPAPAPASASASGHASTSGPAPPSAQPAEGEATDKAAGGAAGGVPVGGVRAAMTPWDAARAAALLLARVTAGVLDAEETTEVAAAVTEVLGPTRLSALAALWHLAHATADDDAEAMAELGRRWCTILGVHPDQPPPPPEGQDEPGTSVLAAAITAALDAITTADAAPALPPVPDRAAARRAEAQACDRARRTARQVFSSHPAPTPHGPTKITGSRPPTRGEQAAARRLARLLRGAAHRERTATQTTSATPPGRLRMRAALAADAQRAAGATPTAEPFTRTARRHVPTPPLRVGIACDVSGSMRALAAPVASAAWILARATAHIPDAQAAAVIFGAKVRPITCPGQTPTRVWEFSATDNTEAFCEALDALDAALDLSRPGAARLLVVVSDGVFTPTERREGQHRITRLTSTGCATLWLALDDAHPMDGTHPLALTDPAQAADTIGQAAARALHNT